MYCAERYAEVLECKAHCDYFDGATIEPIVQNRTEEVVVEVFVDTSHDDNLLAVLILNLNQEIREKLHPYSLKDIKLTMTMYLLLKIS